jgi:hypothetical protein
MNSRIAFFVSLITFSIIICFEKLWTSHYLNQFHFLHHENNLNDFGNRIVDESNENKYLNQKVYNNQKEEVSVKKTYVMVPSQTSFEPVSRASSNKIASARESHSKKSHKAHDKTTGTSAITEVLPTVNSYDSNTNLPEVMGISWLDFISIPPYNPKREKYREGLKASSSFEPHLVAWKSNNCSVDIEHNLDKSRLSEEGLKWCQWALSSVGGRVKVGKSWGTLQNNKKDQVCCELYV